MGDNMDKMLSSKQENELKLALHPDKIIITSDVERELMLKEIGQLPVMEPGAEVAIDSIYCVQDEEALETGIYIRNSLDWPIILGEIKFKIVNNGQVIVEQLINLKESGEIPAKSVRPWRIFLRHENGQKTEALTDWELLSDIKENLKAFYPVIEDRDPQPLSPEQMTNLFDFLKKDSPLQQNELRIIPYNIEQGRGRSLLVTLLIRNGANKPVVWNDLTLLVFDKNKKLVAKGFFDMGNNVIEVGTFFLRTFTFPKGVLIDGEFDLSEWSIQIDNSI